MKFRLLSLLTLIFTWTIPFFLPENNIQVFGQAADDVVYIFAPLPGQALQGIVPVEVSLIVSQLDVAILEFRYMDHPTGTWFLIAQVTESITDGVIAQWDTTTITDGDYDLRLQAITRDQQKMVYEVKGLRVRNYTAIETETPTPFSPTETMFPGQATITPLPTRTPLPPTVTPLPTNPAILTSGQFTRSIVSGSLATLGIFFLLGFYVFLRARLLKRKS
jgi:hypothetical protein